jgi:hypothetical protein
VPRIEKAWQEQLDPVGVSVHLGGAVCHGRPYVTYGGAARSCELGDLLFVHDHQPQQGALERRACIVQAKIFGKNGVIARNAIQKRLYEKWPRFTYTSWPGGLRRLQELLESRLGVPPGPLVGLQRDLAITIPSGRRDRYVNVDDGSRYGMIDAVRAMWRMPFHPNPWRLCSANVADLYRHGGGLSLGGFLTRLVTGKTGRPALQTDWPVSLTVACHWSLMINELLEALPTHGARRQAGRRAPALAFISNGTNGFARTRTIGAGSSPPTTSDGEDPESVFGVIRVATSGGDWVEHPRRPERD